MPRYRVLVVEDDDSMRELYSALLRSHGDEFALRLASDCAGAWDELRSELVDAVVLDWSLPDGSGLDLLKKIRSHPRVRATIVLMASASAAVDKRVLGLEAGADDYLGKPFDDREMIARLRSLLRRRSIDLEPRRVLEAEGMRFDPEAGNVTVGGERRRLHPKELELLKALLRRPNMVLSADYLWETIWGYRSARARHTLESTMSALRSRLGPWGRRIEARPGLGYIVCLSGRS